MIRLVGTEGNEEFRAACNLRQLILAAWPESGTISQEIHIIASAKCVGQPVQDVDIIIFLPSYPSLEIVLPDGSKAECEFSRLCLAVEVKSQSPDRVKFTGNQVEVRYADKPYPVNVSHQSLLQGKSVRGHLAAEGYRGCWTTNIIWLTNCPTTILPKQIHNVVGSDASWDDFIDVIVVNSRPSPKGRGRIEICNRGVSPEGFQRAAAIFSRVLEPSKLDRHRMEGIARTFLNVQQYAEQIGKILLIFKGRGGTGKTMRLIRLAYDLYENQDAQVLLLTYNKALVADITRLLTLMGVRTTNTEHCVRIRTIHSHLLEVLKAFGIEVGNDYLKDGPYKGYKKSLLQIVGGAGPDEVRGLLEYNNNCLQWDHVFVDEAQDWPSDERDILYALHGPSRFVLADGVDQFVRSSDRIDWREKLEKKKSKVVPLSRSLRLKAGLCRFVNTVAQKLGVTEWKIVPNAEAYGGRVIILQGDWRAYCRDRSVHDGIVECNRKDGNSNVDMLFCVHPKLTRKDAAGNAYSWAASMFQNWEYECWDGVDEKVRDKCPTRLEQLRVLQYDSCRGLEGWVVVAFELDCYFQHHVDHFKPEDGAEQELYYDPHEAAINFAKQWMLIPLTRAIDTLVIQIASPDSYMGQIIANTARECGDLVEWVKL